MSFSLFEFLSSGAVISLSEDQLLIFWGNVSKSISPSNFIPSFYQSDFFLETKEPWFTFSSSCRMSLKEFSAFFSEEKIEEENEWHFSDPKIYREIFHELLEMIDLGLLIKGVPYFFSHSFNTMTQEKLKCSLFVALKSLKNTKGYFYGFWNEKKGRVGITPEILFTHSNKHPKKISTMALAGTFQGKKKNFRMEEYKEKREHHYVIEGIKEAAASLGKIEVGNLSLLPFGKISHLMTSLTLHLNASFNFEETVNKLHPTPALGAFPLQAGDEWLRRVNLIIPRGNFGGPVGFYDPEKGKAACYVAIRNVEWNESGMRIGGGGGVIRESCLEKEQEEIKWKIESVKEKFGL